MLMLFAAVFTLLAHYSVIAAGSVGVGNSGSLGIKVS
jgi:hypothetical protein